jgi:hypothetical protein
LNELRLIRADNAAMHAQHEMEPLLLKSPAQKLADIYDSEQKQAIRSGIMRQLTGKP